MEKEIDPMLAKFYEGVEFEQEEVQEDTIEEEATAEETKEVEAIEEEKVEEEDNKSDFVDAKVEEKEAVVVEEVDNSEWLKDFEAALLKKNEYKSLSAEQKALAYLKEQNPYLDEEDLVFKAAQEFGIGATEISEEDLELMTDSEKRAYKAEIKAQEIKRKGLLHQADGYFKEQSDAIELPKIPNPIEADEDYKSYKAQVALQAEQEAQFKKEQDEIFSVIDTASTKIETIEIEPKITLDDSEFTFKSEFKLDENKRKELAEFAKGYTPTQAEIDEYYPQGGKFNAEGYLSHLATIKFSKQIINAAVKEGIATAREKFVEKDLKNSTLRNNETMQQSNREVHPDVAAMLA